MEALTYAFADGITIARRNLTKIIRIPGSSPACSSRRS